MSAGRVLSFGSIALMTVLALGGAAWSVATNPNVAEVQLTEAVANLAAASSYLISINETESVIGTNRQVQVSEAIDYQSPDRIFIRKTVTAPNRTSRLTLTEVGSSCWFQSTIRTTASPLCTRDWFTRLAATASSLKGMSAVGSHNGIYQLNEADSSKLIEAESFGSSIPIGRARVEARIEGDDLAWEQVSFDVGEVGGTVLVEEIAQFSEVNRAPAVIQPPGPPAVGRTDSEPVGVSMSSG